MADLKIDFDELNRSVTSANKVATDFASAESIADDAAAATGHDGLAGKVRDFGDKWDIARGELEEALRVVADYLGAVVDTFTDLDTDLAAATEGNK